MMNNFKTTTIVTILLFISNFALFSQTKSNTVLPAAFLIGEYENTYSKLIKQYPKSLLNVSDDSIELAYMNWMYLLYDMERYSRKIDFNLNGLKIWINVFWNKNGNIDYISFYPKPNSRNMEFDKLKAFMSEFIKNYRPRLKSDMNFSHFGAAKFPSFAEMYINGN